MIKSHPINHLIRFGHYFAPELYIYIVFMRFDCVCLKVTKMFLPELEGERESKITVVVFVITMLSLSISCNVILSNVWHSTCL